MTTDANLSLWVTAPGRVELRPGEVPAPGPGEVLVRARCSLVSTGTELTFVAADGRPGSVWDEIGRLPRAIGYSQVGEVVDLGPGVDRSWLGRRVHSRAPHAAWAARALDRLQPIPDEVSDEDATFTTLASVVMNGLRRARLTWGESVAVFGLGLLGQLSVRLADAVGASPIFGVELSAYRLGKLPRGPGVHALEGGDVAALREAVLAKNRGRLADVVVELTGAAELIPEELELLRDQGRFLLLSSPRAATRFDFHDLCNRRSLTIVGAHGASHPAVATPDHPWTARRHDELFLDWLAAGRLSVAELVSHRFPFDRAEEAYSLLGERRGEAVGVILDWGGSSAEEAGASAQRGPVA